MAVNIVNNAKTRRPTICNALECLLVHRDVAEAFLPQIASKWSEKGVEMRCDPTALSILQKANGSKGWKVVPASPEDFGQGVPDVHRGGEGRRFGRRRRWRTSRGTGRGTRRRL